MTKLVGRSFSIFKVAGALTNLVDLSTLITQPPAYRLNGLYGIHACISEPTSYVD